MSKRSAGILLYRHSPQGLEFFLVHPGGPFWANKDEHAWSIPKGEFADDEDPESAARREFTEETGHVFDGELIALDPIKTPGKLIYPFLAKGDMNAEAIRSNLFAMEWPPRSGKTQEFPEVDKAGWFGTAEAELKINKGQISLIAAAIHAIRTSA